MVAGSKMTTSAHMPCLSTPRSVKRTCAGGVGSARELSDRVFKGERVLFANILAQDAREGAVGAGMRVFCAENAIGGGAGRVVIDGNPGLLEGQRDVGLIHAEDCHVGEGFVLDEDVAKGVDGVFVPHGGYFREAFALQRDKLGVLNDRNEDVLRVRLSSCHSFVPVAFAEC